MLKNIKEYTIPDTCKGKRGEWMPKEADDFTCLYIGRDLTIGGHLHIKIPLLQ